MSSPTPNLPVTAPASTTAPLDDLMLAMDVVDTLRHEQDVIQRELNSDARDAAFVARIREIYAAQGIAVSDEIIRQGVEALKQDRFSYQPPPRSVSVRLAELYVDRVKWFKRMLLTGIGLSVLWFLATVPGQIADSMAVRSFNSDVAEVQNGLSRQQTVLDQLERRSAELDPQRAPISAAAVSQAKLDASSTLRDLRQDARQIASLAEIEAEAFNADREAAARALAAEQSRLGSFKTRLDQVRLTLSHAETLQDLEQQYQTAGALLAGVSMSDSAQAQLATQRESIEAALRLGDNERAQSAVQRFRQTAEQLDLSYTLRVVSRPGVQSGVRRRAANQAEGRSYYLVVEAVTDDGQILKLPITNEETQRIKEVRQFAIRVDESEYNRVRADKQDNGLIDNAEVGSKARGELEPTYQVKVVGGTITDW